MPECRPRTTSVAVRGILRGILTALLLACAACTVAADSAADETQSLSGVVTDAQGGGLEDIALSFFDAASARLPRPALATAISDAAGQFTAAVPAKTPLLVELHGSQGRGRVRIAADRNGQPLQLTYPVRTTVVLLHDNDMHFNFNHREAFAARLEQVRRSHQNVFLLNAGDVLIRDPARWNDPRPEYYAAQSCAIIDTMNDLGYAAMTLGNHEFAYIDDLTLAALRRARFPLLAANIQVTTARLPQPKPYIVLETTNGLTIAVLGLSVATAKEGVRSRDAVAVAREYLYLRQKHPLLVGLTHLGFRTDERLAEAVGSFDVILGGHSHTLVDPATRVNGVLIAQAAGTPSTTPAHPDRPKYLGQVELVLENEQVVEKRGQVFSFLAPESAASAQTAP